MFERLKHGYDVEALRGDCCWQLLGRPEIKLNVTRLDGTSTDFAWIDANYVSAMRLYRVKKRTAAASYVANAKALNDARLQD